DGSAAYVSISGQTGLLSFTGLTSTNRVKTVRDVADTILELGGSYMPTGTWTNMALVTPALGTPTTLVLTNATGLPAASMLSGALANGMTATTQSGGSNDTKIATDAYVDAHFIAGNTATLGTSAISSGACATAVTVAGSGIATTDVIDWGFNGDPTGVTGYAASATGMLTIIAYPTSGNAVFKVCNNTSASITPGAITLNWKVRR
ncbi:MAG: hypothetical protein ABSA86_11430, partial [Oryzomonas sp.]